ncbi:hypothetical protein E4U61_005521 [Claviceps capensis]|nr:hypothetical protein E4U61_005521 [Claviceps capensis]
MRTQRNGEQVTAGTPVDLYQSPSAHDWGIPLSQDPNADDRIALNEMLDPLKSVDNEQFLEQETEDRCSTQLQEMDFSEAEIEDYTKLHSSFYLQLWRRIKQHQDSHAQPILRLAPIPHEDSVSRKHLRSLTGVPGSSLVHQPFERTEKMRSFEGTQFSLNFATKSDNLRMSRFNLNLHAFMPKYPGDRH